MTIKSIIITTIIIIQVLIISNLLFAGDKWQMNITAKVQNAENRLTIGQRPDASDLIDGRYDVPALLAGDIEAYIELEDDKYWKDIRKACVTKCKKKWNIIVESALQGYIIKLSWNSLDIPDNTGMVLVDMNNGVATDMKLSNEYIYKTTGKREFTVEVQTW